MSLTILPQVDEPMDSRSICSTYEDLTTASTWYNGVGVSMAYVGMTTVVTNDPDSSKNGLYILTELPVSVSSWEQAGSGTGEPGKSGVYVGEVEPEDSDDVNVWINPKGVAAHAVMSYSGTMAPDEALGDDGDIYALITEGTCELYFKTESFWVKAV